MRRTLPYLNSLSEFIGGNNDDCGPDAELMGLNEQGLEPANAAALTAIRKRDIVKGWFSPGGGEPISSVYNDLTTFENVSIVDYIPYGNPIDYGHLRSDLIQYAGMHSIVLEILEAFNIPGNQANVDVHFVLIAGLDSTLGYYVLNGDDVQALSGLQQYPGRWVTWTQLASAKPCGAVIFDRRLSNMGVPQNWHWDGSTLTAPNGEKVTLGFAQYIVNRAVQWPPALVPVNADHGSNGNDVQDFALELLYNKANGGITEVNGSVPTPPQSNDNAVLAAIANLKSAVDNLQSALNTVASDLQTVESSLTAVQTAESQDAI